MKLQMAKFLQGTVEEMAVASKNPNKREAAQEFADFFNKVGGISEFYTGPKSSERV